MKSQKFKRIIVLLLVTAMAVAIPGSFAKYVGNQSYKMSIKKTKSWIWNSTNTSGQIVTLPFAGRYAIMVKGGDGATGLAWAGGQHVSDYDADGSIGGTVVGIYVTTEENQKLYVAPGTSGQNQNKGSKGLGGTNDTRLNKYYGGDGSGVNIIYQFLSAEPAGGGGGAASVVYRCTSNGDYSDGDLLFIAGGGGGSPSWNQGYQNSPIMVANAYTTNPGRGGNGGNNYGSNNVSQSNDAVDTTYWGSSVLNSFCKLSYTVFFGYDGTGSEVDRKGNSYIHYGTGGTDVKGTGGKAATAANGLMFAGNATDGNNFLAGGNGGTANYYSGGGGGGYCGGGGGAGTSIDVAAGGGGGGSSCYTSLVLQSETDVYSDMIIKADGLPNQTHSHNTGAYSGNGYVIIKYLGSGGTPGTVIGDPISLESVLQSVLDNFSSNHSGKSDSITFRSTSDKTYKMIDSDPCMKMFFDGRLWEISRKNGVVTIYFTDSKDNTTATSNIKAWKYENGKFYVAKNATSNYSTGTWGYGSTVDTYVANFSKCTWSESSTPPII